MPYATPEEKFNAVEHATNSVLRANQFEETVVTQFMLAYEDFWGLHPDGGSRYTTEEMQAKLEAMPMSTAIEILRDASAFKTFIQQAYPGTLPDKYLESAWEYVPGPTGLKLTQLREAWLKPEPEPEPEVQESVPESTEG